MKKLIALCLSMQVLYAAEDDDLQTTVHIYPSYVSGEEEATIKNLEIVRHSKKWGAIGAVGGGMTGGGIGAGVGGGIGYGFSAVKTGVMIGTPIGLAGGLLVGGYMGAEYGKKAGEEYGNEVNRRTREWKEAPYLDLAFHTTQGDDVVWDGTVRLRPVSPGWRDEQQDNNKLFGSSVQVNWLIGGIRNDQSPASEAKYVLYNSIFNDREAKEIKRYFNNVRFLALADSHVHSTYQNLRASEVFNKPLDNALSINQLVDTIRQMKPHNSGFPKCSWSGRSINSQDDIVNPAIFTCRLLNNLGTPLSQTSLNRFLSLYNGSAPANRNLIIDELYQHREE